MGKKAISLLKKMIPLLSIYAFTLHSSLIELLSVGPYAIPRFGQNLFLLPVLPLFLDERTGRKKKRNNLYFLNFKSLLHVLKKSLLLQNYYPFQKEE